ncbi:hypothetical protein RvY_06864 [Ramazzottius varieornatus]|uniref:Uncharacterized protein n=1 Tax=Ramazzottius varieornatus TaxID=947166 RepID=A0A1D1V034_RAMVA|nr:hypothetical protein RvY_06864 [Ramazzottius varieornatus]
MDGKLIQSDFYPVPFATLFNNPVRGWAELVGHVDACGCPGPVGVVMTSEKAFRLLERK